jgi:hypothetical protein
MALSRNGRGSFSGMVRGWETVLIKAARDCRAGRFVLDNQ